MFWGLTIEPGKHYTQTVEQSFHVSMVALDTRDVATSERDHGKLIQLMVQHEKAEFLVCTLCYGTVFQQSLDLNLTEGEEVTFFTEGRGTLHLTGYLVKDEPLTLDPDMMSLEEMSSSDDVASDSGDWASGEESSPQGPAKVQKPRQVLVVPHQSRGPKRNNRSGSRPRKLAFVLRKNHRRGNSRVRNAWRKRRKPSRIRANSQMFVGSGQDQRSQVNVRSASEQRAILQTSDNVTATLILSRAPGTTSRATASPAAPPGGLAVGRRPGGFLVSNAGRPNVTPTQDTASHPPGDHTALVPMRTSVDAASLPVDNLKGEPCIGRVTRDRQQDEHVPSVSPPTKQQETGVSRSGMESACPDSSPRLPTQGHYRTNVQKGSLKRKPKPKSVSEGSPKGLSGSSGAFPHRKIFRREVPTDLVGQVPPADRQWHVSAAAAAVAAAAAALGHSGAQYSGPVFPDMVEEHDEAGDGTQPPFAVTQPPFDGATSQDARDDPHEQFQTSEARIQPDRVCDTSQHPVPQMDSLAQSRPIAADAQPGCSTQPQEAYPQVGLVPTSLAVAGTGPPMDAPAPGGAQASAMNNVYWSCMSDEATEVALSETGGYSVNAGNGVPVASDIDFLTAEDMTCNGVNIANHKLRLAHGYDVFISRLDLWEAEKASKKGWTILIRRLLDIYFDRMTLAMGKPTHHGNSMDYQPLDQSIIGAIRAFIKARYNIEKRKLIQAISIYCSDCRKSGIPGNMIETPKAMIFPEMQ